jgi:two-component system cell cycle response regulator
MSARILVVDDNPLNVKLLAAKLAHDYYVVSSAAGGVEALAKTVEEKPDVVLLDVMMPDLDGFETCRRIKSNPLTAHIPVVMVTAMSDVADRIRGLEAGADDFLTKPINDLALMARIRSLLRLKMIMDEWRLRESTVGLFVRPTDHEEGHVTPTGGHAVLLDDSAADRQLIMQTLSQLAVRITFAGSVADAVALAQQSDCDLVLASLDLKGEDGLQICPQLRTREATRQLPILLMINDGEVARAAKGLDLGANDYLVRPLDANELLARTRTQLRQKRHYRRMHENYEHSLALALVDPLTGAFNRRYLEAHLPKLVARCRAANKPLSVLMIDLDHFKGINDSYGHAAGDRVLQEVVNRISLSLRPSDLITRMGGEEFAVIMPETELPAATTIAERLRGRIEDSPIENVDTTKGISVTVSIGATVTPPESTEDLQTALKRADSALYEAKKTGRNRVVGK